MCPPNSRIHLAFVVDWSEECLFVWFSEEFRQNHLASWFSEEFRQNHLASWFSEEFRQNHLASWFSEEFRQNHLASWFSEEFRQNYLASFFFRRSLGKTIWPPGFQRSLGKTTWPPGFQRILGKTTWPYILFGPGLTELDNAGKPAWPQSNIWISIWVDWAPSPLYCGWWACQTSVIQYLRDSLLVKEWREKSNDRWLSVLLKEHLCRLVGACFTFVVCTAYSTAVVHVKDSVSTFW